MDSDKTRNYIKLGVDASSLKRYKTVFQQWKHIIRNPNTSRYLWDGCLDVSYGPALPEEWIGVIIVPVTSADASYGTFNELMVPLMTRAPIKFVDHSGFLNGQNVETPINVISLGDYEEDSLTPWLFDDWNSYFISIRLVRA